MVFLRKDESRFGFLLWSECETFVALGLLMGFVSGLDSDKFLTTCSYPSVWMCLWFSGLKLICDMLICKSEHYPSYIVGFISLMQQMSVFNYCFVWGFFCQYWPRMLVIKIRLVSPKEIIVIPVHLYNRSMSLHILLKLFASSDSNLL